MWVEGEGGIEGEGNRGGSRGGRGEVYPLAARSGLPVEKMIIDLPVILRTLRKKDCNKKAIPPLSMKYLSVECCFATSSVCSCFLKCF